MRAVYRSDAQPGPAGCWLIDHLKRAAVAGSASVRSSGMAPDSATATHCASMQSGRPRDTVRGAPFGRSSEISSAVLTVLIANRGAGVPLPCRNLMGRWVQAGPFLAISHTIGTTRERRLRAAFSSAPAHCTSRRRLPCVRRPYVSRTPPPIVRHQSSSAGSTCQDCNPRHQRTPRSRQGC
jgi:hypothetical protein